MLEEQRQAEVREFNKELLQQRVLREQETKKQEELLRAQHEALMEAHQSGTADLRRKMEYGDQLRSEAEQKRFLEEKRQREALSKRYASDLLLLRQQQEQLAMAEAAQNREYGLAEQRRRTEIERTNDIEAQISMLGSSRRVGQQPKTKELTPSRSHSPSHSQSHSHSLSSSRSSAKRPALERVAESPSAQQSASKQIDQSPWELIEEMEREDTEEKESQ